MIHKIIMFCQVFGDYFSYFYVKYNLFILFEVKYVTRCNFFNNQKA